MPDNSKADSVIRDYERLRGDRATYESVWKDIRQLVRPNTRDFNAIRAPGDVRTEAIYDGTAMQSNIDLANAVHSFLMNPSERNFGIKAGAQNRELNDDYEALAWFDEVSEIIASEYLDPRTMFVSSLQECFLELAFGTMVLSQEWNPDDGHLIFKAVPLATAYFAEDHNGLVNQMYRRLEMTIQQIVDKWPDATWDGRDKDLEKPSRKTDVIHAVYPRRNRKSMRQDSGNMPFASCWVMVDKKALLNEGGYSSFPYHVGRWSKSDEEVYGRGPAINCLPEIKMLNRMEFTIIKAAQKAVDPPLVLPHDGFLGRFKTSPGAINYAESGVTDVTASVYALEHRGNLPIGMEMSEQKREQIRRSFYADWVKLMPKKERQTALEISELVEQQLRMMSPMLGRMQTECIVPCIQRSFYLKNRAGHLPPQPPILDGKIIEVDYVSAAARAQAATNIVAYNRLIQNLAILQPAAPDVMDALDVDYIAQNMAILMGVPRKGIRSPDAIIEIRTAKAQAQQMQQLVEAAPKLGKTALDLSKANEAGGLL